LTSDRLATAGVAATALVAVVALQAAAGAFRSEFGAHPDESAHYVTGVMVREYVRGLAPGSPLRFAQDFYDRYPKVAIGHWPPAFYVLQAGWTLPFSPSRVSVLLLMATFAAALATSVFLAVRGEAGSILAATAALLLVALPLVQTASGMLMAELPLALFCFWAVCAFGRFLDQGQAADAVWSAVAASAAILTKGNAFALALAAPAALLLTRRWERLRRPALWGAGTLVVALCAPWYVLTAGYAGNNFAAGPPTADYARAAARLYSRELVFGSGVALAALAVLGLVDTVARRWMRRAVTGRWAAAAALVACTWLFHCVMPSSREARHMVMALPAFVVFVAAGMATIARAGEGARRRRWQTGVAAAAVLLFLGDGFRIPAKSWSGFSAAADLVLASAPGGPAVTLVVSDVRGEGMFISEVARREPRPRRTILRGSKALAESGWNGEGYRLVHETPAEVLAFLREAVQVVVLDTSAVTAGESHPQLLMETVRRYPGRFQSLGSLPLTRAGHRLEGAIEVWRLRPGTAPRDSSE
jgi:hypothetical protein